MAICEICGKKTSFGVSVSHSRSHVSGRHNRTVKPNLRKATVFISNRYQKISVCTRCLRTMRKTDRPRQ